MIGNLSRLSLLRQLFIDAKTCVQCTPFGCNNCGNPGVDGNGRITIYVVPAHQTSDMSRCTISPESRLKLEMVILSTLRFLAILTFQYVNYKFMCPYFNKH